MADADTSAEATTPKLPIEPLADMPAPVDAVSVAPARLHDALVDQLALRWEELKDFVRPLEGEVEGALGEVIALARTHLSA